MGQDQHSHPPRVAVRIVEAVIIALVSSALTAAAASALVIAAMRVEVDQVKEQVLELKGEVRDMRGVIYRPSWEQSLQSRAAHRLPGHDKDP